MHIEDTSSSSFTGLNVFESAMIATMIREARQYLQAVFPHSIQLQIWDLECWTRHRNLGIPASLQRAREVAQALSPVGKH